jgi:isoleucyl-tRNA synthetase
MTEYKDTLNLPVTGFPMKANLPQREPEILQRWQDIALYQRLREQNENKPKFILHDGPPYANGHIHIGHAVNKILKDIVVKSKTLSGFDTPFVPGWDCHGLPIELNVEKKLGKAGVQISPAAFRKACRDYAAEQLDIQRNEFIRLGVIGDWDKPYLTMDPAFEGNIIRALATLIERGHLHQGRKPVYWCIDCGSALAEAEVEYRDKNSPSIDVKFLFLDEALVLKRFQHKTTTHEGEGPLSIVIWTTTPWTLPANQAVAVNPNFEYVIVQCQTAQGKQRLIIAEALVNSVMNRFGITDYQIIASTLGSELEGLKLQHPFYDRQVPIILGEHVTLDSGTGAVHTAPGHGQDDYTVGMRYGLPIDNPVADNGCFVPNTPLFAGEHVNKANSHIIAELSARGALLHEATLEHSYPHCWRHKTPLIFRATPQWFISMEQQNLRRDAINVIFQSQWLPEWGQARIANMVESRPDWCISRQRTWGVPIALFIHKETGQLHPENSRLMNEIAELITSNGIEAWYELDIQTLLGSDAEYYRKVTDILDVWFDSGVSHTAVLKKRPELAFPADLYLEGSDQHRGWFQSSLLTSVGMYQQAPYKMVLTHGFAVDAKGYKMSKSVGNVVAPEKVINSLGADILRLWVAAADYRAEMSVSDEILKRMADTYRRLRNTARYLLANLYDFDPNKDKISTDSLLWLDQWAVERARLLQEQIITAYETYQFHLIYQKIHNFCAIDMGAFYLDIIKDRQYTTQKASLARRSAQTAMFYIMEGLVRWLAPILSFTAEEIWQYMPGQRTESVFLTQWYEEFPQFVERESLNQDYWEAIINIREAVNKELEVTRNQGKIGSGLEAEVDLYCDTSIAQKLARFGDELRFVFITSGAYIHAASEQPEDAVLTEIPGLAIKITPSTQLKCIRCWHRRADVGATKEYPEICLRCVDNVYGEGEVRRFA